MIAVVADRWAWTRGHLFGLVIVLATVPLLTKIVNTLTFAEFLGSHPDINVKCAAAPGNENAAIREGTHPRESTERNIAAIRGQMRRMGWAIDWDPVSQTVSARLKSAKMPISSFGVTSRSIILRSL